MAAPPSTQQRTAGSTPPPEKSSAQATVDAFKAKFKSTFGIRSSEEKKLASTADARSKRNGFTSVNSGNISTNNSSNNVEKKTPPANEKAEDKKVDDDAIYKQIVESSGQSNVLNGYRSITYNFTIAALDSGEVSDPESYRNSELKYVILKSGGKGYTGITTDVRGILTKVGEEEVTTVTTERKRTGGKNFSDVKVVKKEKKDIKKLDFSAKPIVEGFNKESPGRFDMFIDNVEFETIMTSNETSNSTLPTKIKFEIIEPYSINGFIEALHVSAIAAGYTSYLDACFLLKLEFWGYPDKDNLPEPELIPKSSRYFSMGFTEINVEINERGTRYQCSAVPINERAFGQSNVIKKPIKMEGGTVGEILKNLFVNINKQVKDSDDKSKAEKPEGYDIYEIKFPTKMPDGKWSKDKNNDSITNKKLGEILKDNLLFSMVDPGDTSKPNAYQANNAKQPTPDKQAKAPESIKYIPGTTVINFAQNMNINDAIASVVRDSDYVKDILKDIGTKPGVPDQYGFVNYFIIRVEVENLPDYNSATKRNNQKYTYIVAPYKIHYSRIPNYGHDKIKEETLKKLSNRTYNYIYTGQNVDVLNFKLNFNTLFFEAVPAAMGNKATVPSKDAAAPGNKVEVKNKEKGKTPPKDRKDLQQIPDTPVRTVPTPITAYTGGTASQPSSDPYSVLARHMHEAIVNSKASMITGDMEILGDPYYLVTGGIGNYNPKAGDALGTTIDGEADHNVGSVFIVINFRNPIDINSFEDGGMMKFDGNRVPFSGVYQVTTVASTFKEGSFKQKLNILRMPGQVLDSNVRDSDPADRRTTVSNPADKVVPSETRAQSPEQRANSITVAEQLGRGIPTPDTNFTNVAGGLGGYGTGANNPSLANVTAAAASAVAPASGGLGGYGTGVNNPSVLNQTAAGLLASASAASPIASVSGGYGFGKNLNQTYGAISNATPINVSSVVGQTLPTDVASNIRLQSSGLADLNQNKLSSPSLIAIASNVLTGNLPIERATGLIGGSLINSAISSARNLSNIGSGIGKGATISIGATLPGPKTAQELLQGMDISSSVLPTDSISKISGISSDIGKNAMSAVTGIGKGVNSIAGGIGDKISSLISLPSDPQGIAAKVGLDSSKLSGIGAALKSKLPDQVQRIADVVPENVNLKQAASSGLVLDYISAAKIPNIPATPPYSTAPVAKPDLAYALSVVKRGGITALENLYGVSNISKISSSIVPDSLISSAKQSISNVKLNPFANNLINASPIDLNVMNDKLASAKSQLSGLTGKLNIPDVGSLGSAASKFGSASSLGTNPLSSLVGKDPTALSYTGTDPSVRARLGLPPIPPNIIPNNGWGEGT